MKILIAFACGSLITVLSFFLSDFLKATNSHSPVSSDLVPNYPAIYVINRGKDLEKREIDKILAFVKTNFITQESDQFYASSIVVVDETDRWAVSMHYPGNGDFSSKYVFGIESKDMSFLDGRGVIHLKKKTLEVLEARPQDLSYAPMEQELELNENF